MSTAAIEQWEGHLERYLRKARGGSAHSLGVALKLAESNLRAIIRQLYPEELQSKVGHSDLLQDAYAEAIRDFRFFRGHSGAEFCDWLRTILIHNIAEFRDRFPRYGKRDVFRERSLDDPVANARIYKLLCSPLPGPDEIALRYEHLGLLNAAMRLLPKTDQTVLSLRYWWRYRYPEIGVILDMPDDTARKIHDRAVEKLRKHFGVEAAQDE